MNEPVKYAWPDLRAVISERDTISCLVNIGRILEEIRDELRRKPAENNSFNNKKQGK